MIKRYYTPAEAAAILEIHRNTLYRYLKMGILPYIRIGGKILLSVDDINSLDSHRDNTQSISN